MAIRIFNACKRYPENPQGADEEADGRQAHTRTHTRTHRNAMIGEVMAFWAQLRDPACGMPIAP